jgi:hypothetical protein
VSSSWRIPRLTNKVGIFDDSLMRLLKDELNFVELKIHDVTPDLGSFQKRGNEIQAWLDKNPDVSNFVILDDFVGLDDENDEFLESQIPHLVKTDPQKGLTKFDVILAKFILMDISNLQKSQVNNA